MNKETAVWIACGVIVIIGFSAMVYGTTTAKIYSTDTIPAFSAFNESEYCNLSASGEYLTAYKDIRKNCTKETNLDNFTFFKYKP
jgi:hypothetical protein